MALVEDRDYVFFPKVHVLESRATAKMSDACLLGTKRFLFVVPKRSMQSFLIATGITTYNDGEDPAAALRERLADDALTVDALEGELNERLTGDKETRIFEIDRLEELKMKTGFWGQTKVKMPGDKVKLINIRGKGEKSRAKRFYDEILAARA